MSSSFSFINLSLVPSSEYVSCRLWVRWSPRHYLCVVTIIVHGDVSFISHSDIFVCTETQQISVESVKFVPCIQTEFPEFCSTFCCFLLGECCLQPFLCRGSGQLEYFLCHRIIFLSSFHTVIMVRTCSALVNDSSQPAMVSVRCMQ